MRAWTLISFYLLKDIWRRWFETPGGVLSRILVAFILGLLLLVIDTAFTLTAASIQQKISQMGVKTIILSRSVNPMTSGGMDALLKMLDPLRKEGEILRLMQTSATATDEFGERRIVRAYGPDMLLSLAPFLGNISQSGVLVVTDKLPSGMQTTVQISGDSEVEAMAVPNPQWAEKFGGGNSVVLVPAENFPKLLDTGYYEITLFLGNSASDLQLIESEISLLLKLEDMEDVQITSPQRLLDELDRLETMQKRWQGGFGLVGGLAVALVFGSISILEYRQNRYITALLKSFGAPTSLVIGRYALEGVVLSIISGLIAYFLGNSLYEPVFGMIGIEPALLADEHLDLGNAQKAWEQLRWLGIGAVLSVIPIIFAIRTPVGKILA